MELEIEIVLSTAVSEVANGLRPSSASDRTLTAAGWQRWKWKRPFRIVHTACAESHVVVFCLRRPVLCLHWVFSVVHAETTARVGRVSAAAAAAVATYQYSKRTLSETSPSPVGPSARQSPFTDAEHGFLPFSLLPPSLLFSCNLCTNTNPRHSSCHGHGCCEGWKEVLTGKMRGKLLVIRGGKWQP